MYYESCFFITMIFFGSTTGFDEWGFIHFSQSDILLHNCIWENRDFKNYLHNYIEETYHSSVKDLISQVSNFLTGRSLTKKSV